MNKTKIGLTEVLLGVALLLILLLKVLKLPAAVTNMLSTLSAKCAWRFYLWVYLVKLWLGLDVIVTSARRSAAQQLAQHQANPQNPKPVPGRPTDHERGEAVDVNFSQHGEIVLRKATPKAAWVSSKVVYLAELCGLEWGGNFSTYYDPVHFRVKNS